MYTFKACDSNYETKCHACSPIIRLGREFRFLQNNFYFSFYLYFLFLLPVLPILFNFILLLFFIYFFFYFAWSSIPTSVLHVFSFFVSIYFLLPFLLLLRCLDRQAWTNKPEEFLAHSYFFFFLHILLFALDKYCYLCYIPLCFPHRWINPPENGQSNKTKALKQMFFDDIFFKQYIVFQIVKTLAWFD